MKLVSKMHSITDNSADDSSYELIVNYQTFL